MRLKYLIYSCAGLLFTACMATSGGEQLVQENFGFASRQLRHAFAEIEAATEELTAQQRLLEPVSPRNVEPDGRLRLVSSRDWTSGFFPGSLWYMYEYTGDPFWESKAREFTANIEREKDNGSNHDIGFKIYCSYGNGYRLTGDTAYRRVILEGAATLAARYNPAVGAIRSWDHNRDKWEYPVIIDNLMNLELLFRAFNESGDSTFYNVAVNHALTTMRNHFREDNSTYHVVGYDPQSGAVLARHTHQGYAHESVWSRGQAWALYGYTMCYRETGIPQFLEQAKRAAAFIFSDPALPEDLIPYWDYRAPEIPDAPRDASAAAITASALYELISYDPENAQTHMRRADGILRNLSSGYRAEAGKDRGFLLRHSTGSAPHGTEIDVPIVYADYYFLEALMRRQKIENE